jgi:hypothetical protein
VRLFRGVRDGFAPLGSDRVAAALQPALDERGLWLLADDGANAVRVHGGPGRLDPMLLTDVSLGDDWLTFSCSLPVPIAAERIEAVVELCLWLSGDGRVAFAVDRAQRPMARISVLLLAACAEQAQTLIGVALEVLWARAALFEPTFQRVAAGDAADQALAHLDPEQVPIPRRPWSEQEREGSRWNVLDASRELPAGFLPPDGYTTAEWGATFATLGKLVSGEGVVDACTGPVLIHADGLVECYGCAEPSRNPHLGGITVACAPGLRLGRGHLCDRCEREPS